MYKRLDYKASPTWALRPVQGTSPYHYLNLVHVQITMKLKVMTTYH